jgi:K(+)-stimulated pyrophosphate-energized sodium pump
MKIAVIANVRVSNTSRTTKSMEGTLKAAFQGGSVMGLSVGGFALLGLGLIYLIFGKFFKQLSEEQLTIVTNWLSINFIPFTMTVSGYALGCSIIAMFDRVGGGIYTKAADMGADLVGKTEAHIPEDDHRNPATIADNVGDVAGLGADHLESYVGAIISSIVLASYIFYTSKNLENSITISLVLKLLNYPIFFASIGMLAEYYTSYDYSPTKNIAAASNEGASLTITSGLAVGMKSTILPVIILGFGIILADFVGGLYGVAMAAIGMLSVVSATVSVDTYGPIADNAGGISEMSKLEPEVREIADHLDSVGNTTAAISKGFAIGSASLAALSLFASYLYTQAGPEHTTGYSLIINLIDSFSLGGAIIGAALPYFFFWNTY